MATSIEDACSIIPPKLLLPRDETCHCESYERDGYTLYPVGNGEMMPLKHVELLGSGTFGRVWRVESDVLCQYLGLPPDELVLKMGALFHVHQDSTVQKLGLAGTLREGYLQDACSHLPGGKHPHIMPVYGFIWDGGNAPRATYLLTRKMARGDLFDLNQTCKEHVRNATDNRPVWTPAALCDVIAQAGLALGHLHSRNVVHLDVKLENLLVDDKGIIKLGDFGLATKCDALGCMHPDFDVAVGTLDYMAPELVVRHSRFFTADHVVDPGKHPLPFAQALKSPVTTKADVWSLGVALHALALQRYPVTLSTFKDLKLSEDHRRACFAYVVCTQDPCIHESELAAIGPEVWALIKWMLTKDPSRRPTMEQVLLSPVLSQALQKYLPAVIAAGGWVPTPAAAPAVPPGFPSLLPAPAPATTESSAALAEAQALHLLQGAQAAAQLQAEEAQAASEQLAQEQAQARQQMAAMLGAAQAQARRIVAAAEEEAASIRSTPTPAPVPEPQPITPATCLALLLLSARTAQPRLPQRLHPRPALVEGTSSGPSEAAASTEPPATTTTTASPPDSTGSELTSISTGSTGSAEGEDACPLDASPSNDVPAKSAPAVCVVVVEAPAATKPLQLAAKPPAYPQRKASPVQAPTTATTTVVATSPAAITTTTSAAAPAECLVTEQRAGRRRGRRGGRKHRRSGQQQQQQQQDAVAVSSPPAARVAPAAPAAEARPEPAHPWWLRRRQQKKAKAQGRQ